MTSVNINSRSDVVDINYPIIQLYCFADLRKVLKYVIAVEIFMLLNLLIPVMKSIIIVLICNYM